MFVTSAMTGHFRKNTALRRRADAQNKTFKAIQDDIDHFADHIDAAAAAKIFGRENWARSSVPFMEVDKVYQACRKENLKSTFTIMADFRDSFRLINRLQEVLLRGMKTYRETEDFSDDGKMAAYDKVMRHYLDQYHVVKGMHEGVTCTLPYLSGTLEQLKCFPEPREKSITHIFCEEMNGKISDDMDPDLHTEINVDAHIQATQASHRWAESRMDAIDVDLAFLYYLAPFNDGFIPNRIVAKMPLMESNWKDCDEKINLSKILLNSIAFPTHAAAPSQTTVPTARHN